MRRLQLKDAQQSVCNTVTNWIMCLKDHRSSRHLWPDHCTIPCLSEAWGRSNRAMQWHNISVSLLLVRERVKDRGPSESSLPAARRIKMLEDRTLQGLNPACFPRYVTLIPSLTPPVHQEDSLGKHILQRDCKDRCSLCINLSQTYNHRDR